VQAIKDLTPMSKRTSGSDRIAKLISFALILSLFQFISVVQATKSNAASTGGVTSQIISTGGGGGLGESNCPTGSVLYEIVSQRGAIDNGYALTRTYGNCANLNAAGSQINAYTASTSTFGGSGDSNASQWCGGAGSTRVIIGARVYKTQNGYASGIQLICRDLPNTPESSEYWTGQVLGNAGSAVGNWNDLRCPAGTAAIGLYVAYGGILDKFGFNCGPVTGATQSPITSVTLSLTSKTYPYSSNLYVSSIVGGSGAGDFLISSISNGTATGCAYSSLTISSSTSGTCTVTVTKMADTNYAATSRTETFNFIKASLTITASSPIVNLGDAVPVITPTYSGFVNSENASSSAFTSGLTVPTCSTSYTSSSPIDTSPATTCSGGSSTGYSFSYVTGRVLILSGLDKSVSLNGTNQQLVTPDNSNLDIAGAITLEAWVNPSNANARGTVAGKWLSYMLQAYDGKWIYWMGNASDWSNVNTGVPVVANEWQHVALTRAASTNSVNFYVNGALLFTGTAGLAGTGDIRNTNSSFTIGSHNEDSDFFPGKIDEVRLWNVVRSQSDIQTDLKTWGPANSSGLVAYYDFNEMAGSTTVYNRSSTTFGQLDLTSRNSPTISSVETSTVVQAYTVVTFPRTYLTSNGGWRVPTGVTKADLLVVGAGGGGSGGNTNPGTCESGGGGGGGGGQVRTLLGQSISANSVLTLQVGAGGPGGFGGISGSIFGKAGNTGGSTVVSSFTSLGGGGGGTTTTACRPSPGGTSGNGTKAGGAAAAVNGAGGGGGGGDSVAGSAGTGVSGAYSGGAGGAGSSSSITGLTYGGGGGGSHNAYWASLNGGGQAGTGGNGGGGSGGTSNITGTPNTGGGGGGGQGAGCCAAGRGGDGATGVVVLRYITNAPTILIQPLSDTTTAGIVETFTVTTSAAPAPLTKSVQWQFTADTTTGTTGWTNVSTGSGFTTDTFTTAALTKSMNKYRYRAIVTFSDTSILSVQETSSVVVLTINDSITITSDTSTITRKYGSTQTPPRNLTYSGGTTISGAVGSSTSHTVLGAFGILAGGKIVLDTSTSTIVFRVDTRTAVGTYVETITVTDARGATATYAQRVVVTPADTLTISSETPTATTYTGAQAIFTETVTVTGLVGGDSVSAVTYNYSARAETCANGGLCNVGDIGPGGGYVFYVSPTVINVAAGISTGGIYLEAAPVAAQGTAQFGCTGTNTSGTSYSVGSGAANTLAIINSCATAGIAARVTSDLTYAGFSDWFMPSLDEMTAIYNNLYNKTPSLGGFSALDYGSSSQGISGYGYSAYWWFGVYAASGQTNKNLAVAYRPVRAFNPIYTSSINYGPSTTKPTSAGTYTITPSSALLANDVSTANYVSVIYKASTFTINKAVQETITITSKLGVFSGNPSKLKLTTSTVSESGTVTYAIVQGGSINNCQVVLDEMIVTTAGTCKVVATMAATLNRLQIVSDTATITFTQFVSSPVQVQLYPNMIPLNGGNSLETNSVTASTLVVSSISRTGAGSYTIAGTGFSNIEVVRIGGTDLTGSNYTVGSVTSITLTGVSSLMGPLFIRRTDGQEVVNFQVTWN
jgi:hypothetical protein